jgi:predicted thioesterase
MAALMEKAASTSLLPFLDCGQSSVGTKLFIEHLSATPVGMKVRAESEITSVDRRRVSFLVKAYDETGLIGEGTHERFIIDSDRFIKKVLFKTGLTFLRY